MIKNTAHFFSHGLFLVVLLVGISLLFVGCEKTQPVKDAPVTELKSIIEDVRGATAYRYNVVDSAGNKMDTAKIIADPAGGYMAISHTYTGAYFEVHLATSTDLLNWTFKQSYGSHTHQPYLAATSNGGFVLANETDNGLYNWIQVRYYNNRDDLLANNPARTFVVPHTQVPVWQWAEGTPNIYSVTLNPDIDHSTIDIGFHYFKDGNVDRQARGTLTDFTTWSSQKETEIDDALLAFGMKGNIGDRDNIHFLGKSINIHDGQFIAGDFDSWRAFLWDGSTKTAIQLNIRTHKGSQTFANPTFTLLPAPGGGQAIVVTHFIPSENSAPGEAGELIYYKKWKE